MRKFTHAAIQKDFRRNWPLYVMVIPAVVFYILFAYIPMFGNIMAFKEFIPGVGIRGFFIGEWVG